jgi:hypothetical protein
MSVFIITTTMPTASMIMRTSKLHMITATMIMPIGIMITPPHV